MKAFIKISQPKNPKGSGSINKIPLLNYYKDKLGKSPIAYRLTRGAFWSLTGGVASRALTMGASIVIARFLGKEGYGEVGMVQSTASLFGVFVSFGLGLAATKYIAEFRQKDPEKTGRIYNFTTGLSLLSGGVGMVVLLAASSWLARETLSRPDLATLIAASSVLLFISNLVGIQSAALSGFEAFKEIAKINMIQGLITPLIAIPCVVFYSTQGAIAALTINMAFTLILYAMALRQECRKCNIPRHPGKSFWSETSILWKYSFPTLASGILIMLVTWITNLLLVNRPGGYAELGLFNAANQWRMVVIFLPALLNSALLPVLSDLYGRGSPIDFKRTSSLALRVTWTVGLPLTVSVIILCKPLAMLFGKQFLGAEKIIPYLMVACLLTIAVETMGCTLIAAGRMWICVIMNSGWAGMLIISSVILVPRFGGCGLAIAYLCAFLIHNLWLMLYIDAKLAPKLVSEHWRLIFFSLAVLFVGMMISLNNPSPYAKIVIILFSLIPLFEFVRSGLLKHNFKPQRYKNIFELINPVKGR
jgi:O-antigen/teichoic acid export membrane protein